jgi:hypothetical protein
MRRCDLNSQQSRMTYIRVACLRRQMAQAVSKGITKLELAKERKLKVVGKRYPTAEVFTSRTMM